MFIPYAGIHNDEALFSVPIYQHYFEFRIRAFHHNLPLMIMPYIGTLKTLLYLPIFRLFAPGAYSLRLPMVFAGALTIFFFFLLARRISGRRAALVATVLLATDPMFLLTDTFDWGPVALEHLLLVTGCLAVVKFSQERAEDHRWLAVGFFCFGLALWNKAVFLWAMTGLVAAVACVCWREVRTLLTRRRAAIAAAFFALGSSPFLIYNIHHKNATLQSSAHLEVPEWGTKFIQVWSALDGESLFNYIVAEESSERRKAPSSVQGRIAMAIRQRFGEHRSSGGYGVVLACLIAVPLWWRSRAAWFSLVFCPVTWLMMAITKGAGGSAHHAVLLWPFPQLFAAIVLAAIPWRAVTGLCAAAIAVANLLVINQHLLQFETDGSGFVWTDAIYGLDEALRPHASEKIYVTDWGMQNPLALLQRGRLKLEIAESDFESDSPAPPQLEHIAEMAADREGVFIGHVAGKEAFVGSRERANRAFTNAGLRKEVIQVIADSNGRPVFEIFRWVVPPSPGKTR